ncbi:hypothetical protein F4802DRAFT_396664 [Xylaria palmicola]|nr:hypothetical protein F4802DRAFT_396664 [Xylaria palmicola]
MATIGNIKGSVASFTNENTAALVNINLDFSLFRCEAKPEYVSVGTALTVQRREEAETGQIHRTACTLGFLFQEVLPDTPALFKAYGRRVTDILAQPNINPQGTENDGPFRSFIGADCTSIWAAATSSDASIAIHLLACMLACAFDPKTATSIWFEIVQGRKQEIDILVKDNKMIHPHTYLAAKQTISRAELATWDTSARAWLRRADQSKTWEKHQFSLIVENINLPYTAPGTTYSKVIVTWVKSMQVLNNLLGNLPQQANDRAILLAISSWHLYPNLLVFHNTTTNVNFKDSLFPSSAVLSLGLEYQTEKGGTNIRWSLALSHLRHYGDPVAVRSNEDLSRVSMPQFWLVALGSLFRTWNLRASEIPEAIDWLGCLDEVVKSVSNEVLAEITWIVSFSSAAKSFLGANQNSQSMGLQLIKFGWRRACRLFGENHGTHVPYFGLRNPSILRSLDEDDTISKGLVYLREIVSSIGLDARQVLVSFTRKVQNQVYCEWATAYASRPQGQEGGIVLNRRWIHFRNHQSLPANYLFALEERRVTIENIGEKCEIITDRASTPHAPPPMTETKSGGIMRWPNPPLALLNAEQESIQEIRYIEVPAQIRRHTTNTYGYSVWVKQTVWEDSLNLKILTGVSPVGSLQDSLAILKEPKFAPAIVGYLRSIILPPPSIRIGPLKRKRYSIDIPDNEYLNITTESFDGVENTLMIQYSRPSELWLQSVMVLQMATMVYDQLPGATVSLRIVDLQLHKASWTPEQFRDIELNEQYYAPNISRIPSATWFQRMTRAQAFGCIAMFESGRFNIRTEHLADAVALCTEDSIFVAGIMLRDPSSKPTLGPQVRHLVGSIGQTGLVLLVSPLDPRIRPTRYNPASVEHKLYDGRREDKFQGVSLHLSFTEWKMPLDWECTGEIDQEVFLLESVLSVMHNGKWIGDIDVLGLEKTPLDVFETDCKGDCAPDGDEETSVVKEITSLDDWEELLDPPPSVGIFRARSNWVARLAVSSILIQQRSEHCVLIIGGAELCWKCLCRHYAYPELHIPQIIID